MLLSILSADELEAAELYELLRRKTLRFFQWKGSPDADELADETLMRVGKKLGEGAPVGKAEIGPYVRGVARMVFLESLRQEEKDRRLREHASLLARVESDVALESRIRCLDEGLASLDADGRSLILGYYSDPGDGKIEQRKRLADSLGISLTALRIRAHRLRERLASIVLRCLESRAG